MRNRRYVQRRGPLVVYGEDNGIKKAFRNISGVEVADVTALNLLQLAPGGHLGRFVIFTDGDITYERTGAVRHCVEQLVESGDDLLMQNDGFADDNHGWGLCAGFMAVRSTAAMVAAFTVDESRLGPGWDDQMHLNAVRVSQGLKHHALPLGLFPNGQYFGAHAARLQKATPGPFLVHFNWIVGREKRGVMATHGKWYVAGEWD